MPSRAPHMKSRYGCNSCKTKRVKCDERKPSCARCVRIGSQCHYQNTIIKSASISPGKSLHSTRYVTPGYSAHVQDTQRLSYDLDKESSSGPSPSLSQRRFSTKDLELVFHCTISASFTPPTNGSSEELCQHVVPQEAFSNLFLTYGLLSISSLHIAHLQPSEAEFYNNLGVQHYNSAIELLKPALQQLGSGSADSLNTFITLIGSISLAMQEPPIASDYLEVVLEKISSLHAVRDVIRSVYPTLEMSSIDSWLSVDAGARADATSAGAEDSLDAVECHIHAEVESELLRYQYVIAIRYLRYILHHKEHVLIWPLLISEQVCQAMAEREPAAVTILAFYGALLDTSASAWWVGDKGRRIVSAASAVIPPEWKNLIRWAFMFVNLPQEFMTACFSVESGL